MGLEARPPPDGRPAPDASEAAPSSALPEPQEPATSPSPPDLPDFAKKADDLEAIKKAVDDAAAVGGGLWLSYLFVLFYLAVAAGAVTHADLFFERSVKLPFLNVELPLLAFFFLAPILFLFVHAYTLVHLVLLTNKTKRFDEAVRRQGASEDGLRQGLPSNIFIQFLAGPATVRAGPFGWLLRLIAWSTLAVAPILLLLLFQVQFLPFHSSFITWTQRIAIVVDLALIWWLWGKILRGRKVHGARRNWIHPISSAAGLVLSLAIVLFASAVATFPLEWQEHHLLSAAVLLHDSIFKSSVDTTTRRRWLPFSSTLVLPGLNIYEGLNIDDPEKAKWRDYLFRARGRELTGAILDFAILPKVDFEGAELGGASMKEAQLQGASLKKAQLRNASLDHAQLRGASLDQARLQNATLEDAHLQGASLDSAELQGASLDAAQLQGASLDYAKLAGASLYNAELQGASLVGAQLQGASLDDAQLQGASLIGAQLQGASLARARLQATSLDGTELEGASLNSAQLQGASLELAIAQESDLSGAFLWRTNPVAPSKGEVADIAAIRLPDAPKTWLPLWKSGWEPPHPWNNKDYEDLRRMMESLPPGALRDQALERIRSVDCANPDPTLAPCDPSLPTPPEADAWRKSLEDTRVDDAAYADVLAVALKTLVCSGDVDTPYVLGSRSVSYSNESRLLAAGRKAPALVDFIMSKECPVSASLTDADRARLLHIKQEALERAGK